jgi:hypothetical protein
MDPKRLMGVLFAGAVLLVSGCSVIPPEPVIPDDGSVVINIQTYESDTYGNESEVDLSFHVKIECFNQEGAPCKRTDEEGKVVGVYPYDEDATAPWAWGFKPEPGATGVITVTITLEAFPGQSAKCQILAQPSDRIIDEAEAYIMAYDIDVPTPVKGRATAQCIATVSAPLS